MAKDLISEFVGAISTDTPEPNTTYNAIVSRVDADGTVWVSVEGSSHETPTASVSSEVKRGDAVKVEWRNNKLYIAGNYTDPAVGAEKVESVNTTAREALELADSAKADIQSVNQYFWHVKSGPERGAHITEIPQAAFAADPSNGGGNLLARSDGIVVRNGTTELAVFGANGAQIGKTDGTQSYLAMDYHSMQMIDKEGNVYFHVSDLRDNTGAVTEKFWGDGSTKKFSLSLSPQETVEVTINGTATTAYTASYRHYTFTSAPADGAEVAIKYKPLSGDMVAAKAFTMGQRATNSHIGLYSHAEGRLVTASGFLSHAEGGLSIASGEQAHAEGGGTTASGTISHAEGSGTVASGTASHAEGEETSASGWASHAEGLGTIAKCWAQTAIGMYNSPDSGYTGSNKKGTYIFIIGNGSESAPSNALTVDWSGNVKAAGYVRDTIISASPTITRTSGGTILATAYKRSGHVATLRIQFSSSGAVAGGVNIFVGTLPSGYRPLITINGCGYYGKSALIGQISAGGELIIRNASSTSNTFTNAAIYFTYIID